jgi:SAM-dependent methyltransferase
VLDVGAGVGALSLVLQAKNIEVEALEISKVCYDILHSRGIVKVINQDFFAAEITNQYDTILMIMNGIGICGTIDVLPKLFKQFNKLLKPGGQILLDSSDVSYLFKNGLPENHYYGEIDYQYEYQDLKGPWFKWLYVDMETLAQEAQEHGFQLQVLSEDSNSQYLARLIRLE